jgi:hypothetical protein
MHAPLRHRHAPADLPRGKVGRALACLFGAVLALETSPAHAQTMWLDRDAPATVRVEWLSSPLRYDLKRSATYALFATARVPVARHAWAVVEVPWAREELVTASYADWPVYFGSQQFGNVYVGGEFAPRRTGLRYEAGVRLPTQGPGTDGTLTGYANAGVERQSAFVGRATALRLGAFLHREADARLPLGWNVGVAPAWQVPSRGPGFIGAGSLDILPFSLYEAQQTLGTRHALFVDTSANLRVEGEHVRFGAGFAMRWLAGHPAGTFAENQVSELSFALDVLRGPVHPAVTWTLPLDEDQKTWTSNVLSLSLNVADGHPSRWHEGLRP